MSESVASDDPALLVDDQGVATYRGEPLTGVVYEYDEAGVIILTWSSYSRGLPSGCWEGRYADDSLRFEGSFFRGRRVDRWCEWHPGGILAVEETYSDVGDGVLLSRKRWDASGELVEHHNDLTVLGIDGDAIDVDAEGNWEHHSPVLIGERRKPFPRYLVEGIPYSGQAVLRFAPRGSGRIARVFTYQEGRPNGPTRRWRMDGTLESTGAFYDGEPAGIWLESAPDGTVRRRYEYSYQGTYIRTLPPGATASGTWTFPGLAAERADLLARLSGIAESVASPDHRADSLASVAVGYANIAAALLGLAVAAGPGTPRAHDSLLLQQARRIPSKVVSLARSIPDPARRATTRAKIAMALAGADPAAARAELLGAENDARVTAPSSAGQARALGAIAMARADSDPGAARALLGEAEQIARSVTAPGSGAVLADVAKAMITVDREAARTLLLTAERFSRASTGAQQRDASLTRIAEFLAEIDPASAERIAGSLVAGSMRAHAVGRIVRVLAEADPDASARLARSLTDPYVQVTVLGRLLPLPGQDPQESIPSAAEHLARTLTSPDDQDTALIAIVRTTLSEALTEPDPHAARRLLAEAERIARSVTSDWDRVTALGIVVPVLVGLDIPAAERVLADAERLARTLPDPCDRDEALCALVRETTRP